MATALLVSPGCVTGESGPDSAFEAVRRQATTVEQNDLGYWQADLGNGHILIYVPAGPFDMGSRDGEPFEQPVHRVMLSGYWIGKFPVTVAQSRTFVADAGYVTDAERGEGCWVEQPGDVRYDASWQAPYVTQREDEPVLCVSWNDAMAYATWMSALTGLHFTLPTEAQWEKAARGTDGRAYPWGDVPPDGSQANSRMSATRVDLPGAGIRASVSTMGTFRARRSEPIRPAARRTVSTTWRATPSIGCTTGSTTRTTRIALRLIRPARPEV